MQLFRQTGGSFYIYGFLPFLCCLPVLISAEEIAIFKLTDIEGNVGVSYQTDELLLGPVNQAKTRNQLSTTREDIFILTHSYIYHPNLLSIDLGGGMSYVQNELESSVGNTETDDDLDTITAKLRFLEKKPYPFSIYYDRTNPMISPSLTERFVQENERYGLNAAITQTLLPFTVNLEAFHSGNKGSGVTRIVDDKTDQVLLRAYKTIGKDGYGQLTYHNNQRESDSGVIGLGINHTDTTSESTSFDSHFSFGATNQFRLSNLISYFTQDNLPDQKEFRFVPNLSWQHSRDFSTYYRFDYLDNEIDTIQSKSRSAAIGGRMNHSKTLATTAEVHGADNTISSFENRSTGVSGSISYLKPLSFGRLNLGMGLGYDEAKRSAGIISVPRENVYLKLTDRVALQNNFVDEATIQLFNANDQLLTLNVDYKVTTIGATTYIERVVGGRIDELGETVYVSYQYTSDSRVVYATLNQSYTANLDFLKHYSIYAEFSDSEIDEKEGSSNQLTSVRRTRTGFRFNRPFWDEAIRLGGEVIREDQEEDLSPYDRKTLEVYVESEITPDSKLRLSSRNVEQDNLISVEDIDLERQSGRLTLHPWPRSSLVFEMSNEKDVGGSIHRRVKEKSIVGRWRIRKLVFEIDGRSIVEIQGNTEREHNLLTAKLNREF